MNKDIVTEALREVGRDGWGGGESLREGTELAVRFISLLPKSVAAPAVVEGNGGGLALEWVAGDGGLLKIEFLKGGLAAYSVHSRGVGRCGETTEVGELARLISEAIGSEDF